MFLLKGDWKVAGMCVLINQQKMRITSFCTAISYSGVVSHAYMSLPDEQGRAKGKKGKQGKEATAQSETQDLEERRASNATASTSTDTEGRIVSTNAYMLLYRLKKEAPISDTVPSLIPARSVPCCIQHYSTSQCSTYVMEA